MRWPATCGPLVSVGIAHRVRPGLSVVRHLMQIVCFRACSGFPEVTIHIIIFIFCCL